MQRFDSLKGIFVSNFQHYASTKYRSSNFHHHCSLPHRQILYNIVIHYVDRFFHPVLPILQPPVPAPRNADVHFTNPFVFFLSSFGGGADCGWLNCGWAGVCGAAAVETVLSLLEKRPMVTVKLRWKYYERSTNVRCQDCCWC